MEIKHANVRHSLAVLRRDREWMRFIVWWFLVYLCFYFAWWTYMRHHRQCCIYRVAPKNVSHKVLPISLHRFSNCFHWCILWKICSKVVPKHTTTPYLRRYTTLCKMCKIHQYLVKIWTKVWSLIFWPIMKVKLCFVSDSLSVFKHKKTILSYRMGQKIKLVHVDALYAGDDIMIIIIDVKTF